MGRTSRHAALLAVLLVAGAGQEAFAKARLTRVLDWRSGLPVSFITAVEQDPEGFLWLTSWAGVFRYDGTEMVPPWEQGPGLVVGSAAAGMPLQILVRSGGGVRNQDGSSVTGPDGQSLRTTSAVVASDGGLWALQRGAFFRRAREGAWSGPFGLPEGAQTNAGPSPGRDGSILVPCRDAVYRIDPAGRVSLVASVLGAIQSLDRSDGSTAIGTIAPGGSGHVYEVRGGIVREIDRCPTRFMGLAERAGALWVCYDVYLARVAAGRPREIVTGADGLLSGGPILVDHEGSLWVGTFRGLVQFPEPDSMSWQPEASCVGRRVIVNGDDVWMSSWSGLYRARLEPDGWTVTMEPGHINAPCADRSGTVWAGGHAFTVSADGAVHHVEAASLPIAGDCSVSARGRLWFPTSDGLYVLDRGDRAPHLVWQAHADSEPFMLAYEDSRGTLWTGRNEEVCRAPVGDVLAASGAGAGAASTGTTGATTAALGAAASTVAWTCTSVGAMPTRLHEMESGAMWLTTMGSGVWRFRSGRWEPIPAAADLASSWANSIAPSPSGGVWIVGEGTFLRVRERSDLPAGWEVLERVGLWQGLPTSGVIDVVEGDDGALWAATNLSLVRIAPEARRFRPEPLTVAFVEATVDGQPLDASSGRSIELPYRRNRLELRFAALSYRDPSLIRYRTRVRSHEAWSAPTRRPSFRFVDLPPGKYDVEVEASLDGARWSRADRTFAFVVLRPWYRTWWFFGLSALALAAALALAYRIRVQALLTLERQRMRIAMDLHDEVGSGLGSIGVLAGLLGRPDMAPARRAELTARITGVTGELSQSLGDIVWSLRAGSGTLDSLWAKILDRARPLFANGSPRLTVEAPDAIPDMPLSLNVRRNVSLIVIEALHNAARHAEARTVSLSLHTSGEECRVVVSDDGRGFLADRPADATRRGLGLEGMKLRAAEMRGAVEWRTEEGGGTTVEIRFRGGRG